MKKIFAGLTVSAALVIALVFGLKPSDVKDCHKEMVLATVQLRSGLYRTVNLPAIACPLDGGFHVPLRLPREATLVTWERLDGGCDDPELCDASEDAGMDWKAIADPCACAPVAACQVTLLDGGRTPGVKGITYQPGRWQGTTCRRKACVEFAGVSSMPQECQ